MAEKLYNMNENITKIPQKKRSSSKDGRSRSGHHQHKDQNQKTNSQKSKQSCDSGARDLDDLSPEPNYDIDEHLEGRGGMMIHVAALSALNNEVMELRARLQKSDIEKEELSMQVKDVCVERDCLQRHLEVVGQAHESRITEMHCVIVELSKKNKVKEDGVIMEENEPEGSVSELSFQEGSVYNSDLETANYDQESETQEIDVKEHLRIMEHKPTVDQSKFHQHQNSQQKLTSPSTLPTTNYPAQIQGLQEEILHLRSTVALLQSELACREQEVEEYERDEQYADEYQNDLNAHEFQKSSKIVEENENDKSNYTSDDLCETADIFDVQNQQNEFSRMATAQCRKTQSVLISPSKHSHGTARNNSMSKKSNTFELPVTKVAERVKLKRTMEDNYLTGNDLTTSGIYTTEMAEHLVSDLLQPEGESNISSELHNEVQRLQRRVEHLKLQNTVISLTLSESKQHCNHLYLLCGKYESNAVALQQALNVSDRAIEAYDVMMALLESKLNILEGVESADENRDAVESIAHLLLRRLNNEIDTHSTSLGYWQNTMVILQDSSQENLKEWSEDDDKALRNHVSKLKGERSLIQNTVVTLESPFSIEDAPKQDGQLSPPSARNSRSRQKLMDLETAVLMQELMSMREDISELKHQAELSDKEKLLAHEKMKALQSALVHLQSQLVESEALLAVSSNSKERFSYSEAEHNASIERELVEALGRESRLKARLQGLAGSLESAARLSEERHSQVQITVSELKQTNVTLNQSLERSKRKYQSRVKRLEQQLLGLSMNSGSNERSHKSGSLNHNQLRENREGGAEAPKTTL